VQYQQQCRPLLPLAKATHASNLHLTLHFIGGCDANRQQALQLAASSIKSPTVTVTLDKSGYFKKPKIFWLGCTQNSDALISLVNALARAIQPYTNTATFENFVPHVSLFRKFSSAYQALNMPAVDAISFTTNRFVLMESISTADGVQYRPIQSYTLG